jgi:ribosomal protein S17
MLPASLRQYPYTLKVGTVTRVGGMDRTVRVAHRHTVWDRHIRKMYPKVTTYLVSDPRESLREGDVIEFSSGAPKSRLVRHVVERIIAPFGEAIENRPPVMSREERDAERAEKRLRKIARRQERDPTAATTGGDPDRVGRIRGLVMERLAEEEKRRTKESAT